MDQTEEDDGTHRYSRSKIAVFICFTLSAGLLLSSLLHPNPLTSRSSKLSIQSNAASVDLHDR